MGLKLLVGLVAIVVGWIVYNNQQPRVIKTVETLNPTYDYIVVGSGSAGAVVANRLSKDAANSVLLLEAGEQCAPLTDTPCAAALAQRSASDWNYTTKAQKTCCNMYEDKVILWPRGKCFGGSSSINYMLYIRGNRHDYDGWAKKGCTGWSYRDVLPYFMKSENSLNEEDRKSGYRGTEGELYVSDLNTTAGFETFLAAAKELNYPVIDINGKNQLGVSKTHQATVYRGRRWSTARAFLDPAQSRSNLHIAGNALVRRVVIEKGRAVGVEMERDGKISVVKARKEVILSAGAIGSPQILMLSGIGPKAHLDSLGIPVVADLPVGENLHDHIIASTEFYTNVSLGFTDDPGSFKSRVQHSLLGTGSLTSTGLVEGSGFFRTKLQQEKHADIQVMMLWILMGFSSAIPSDKMNNINSESWEPIRQAHEGKLGFAAMVALMHPRSKGDIRLRSTNPRDYPIIDPKFLSDERDIHVLAEGVKIAEKLASTRTYKRYDAKPIVYKIPACPDATYGSDEYWTCRIRDTIFSNFHPVGTCKMGALNDPTAVVDPELRVKGIQGLRVADASIMPDVPAGNINAPVIMVGEKAADLILGTNSVQHIPLPADIDQPDTIPNAV